MTIQTEHAFTDPGGETHAVHPNESLQAGERFETLLERIGQPRHRDERFAIYQGNSEDLLGMVPDAAVNLTFTSPPYNIGKEYERVVPHDHYVEWCASWASEIARVTSNSGAFVLNVGYLAVEGRAKSLPISYLLWNRVPLFFQQEIVWNYGAGVATRHTLSPRNEKLLWYVKNADSYCFNLDAIRDPDVAYPNQKKNGKLRCNTLGKNPSDVWQIAKVTSGAGRASAERTPHPAQFPLDLCERVLKGFSHPGDVILDPFVGSGSTIDACMRFGRYGIGFEIREDYCDLAFKRARATVAQLSLEI